MRWFIFAFVLAASFLVIRTASAEQFTTYRVRIYNDTNVEIRVKIIGFHWEALAVRELDIGEKALIPRMLEGDRAFVAWDDVTQEVVSSGIIRVDSNMRVRFKPAELRGYAGSQLNLEIERTAGEP